MIIKLDNYRSGGCSDSADEALPMRAHLPREMPSAGHLAQKPSSEVDQDDRGDGNEDDGGDDDQDDSDDVDHDDGGDPTAWITKEY